MTTRKASRASRARRRRRGEQRRQELLGFAHFYLSKKFSLEMAGIYFVAAVEHERRGSQAYVALQDKVNTFRNLFHTIESTKDDEDLAKLADNLDEDDLVDCLQNIRRLELSYEPVVQEMALAILATIASAEAFINEAADIILDGGAARNAFDRLPVQGKWLFLPAQIRKPKLFGLDRPPLQQFVEAVRCRNELMHFKGISTAIGGAAVPPFLERLGLLPMRVKAALTSVQKLIREFSIAWKGGYGPDWLYPESAEFRRPCFYLGDREAGMVLWAEDVDKDC